MKKQEEHAVIGKINFTLKNCVKLTKKMLTAQYGNKQVLGTSHIERGDNRIQLSPTGIDRVFDSLQKVLIKEGYIKSKDKKD